MGRGPAPPPTGSKCRVPRLCPAGAVVARPRLEELLADRQRLPVTLVTGPPGAGRTTLLALGLARPGSVSAPVAWLSLDRGDDGPVRLAHMVVAALAAAGLAPWPGGEGTPAAARTGAPAGCGTGRASPPVGEGAGIAVLDAAFRPMVTTGARGVLVVDDAHAVVTAGAQAVLARVVEQAPPGLDVVVAGRAIPAGLRAALPVTGRCRELGETALGFTAVEAVELFAARGLDLTRRQARALWQAAEGWAAGLQMAATALEAEPGRRGFVPSVAGARRAVADHLQAQVLDREGPATREFLLRTSVARCLTADLAAALTADAPFALPADVVAAPAEEPRAGEGPVGDLLADLERRGLLVADGDGIAGAGVYRHPALLGNLLRSTLRRRSPATAAALHRRAAAWYLARGHLGEAEAHARAAGRAPDLLGAVLVRRWVAATLSGRTPAAPLEGIPGDDITRTHELALVAAADACARGARSAADGYRRALAEMPPGRRPVGEAWERATRLLEACHALAFGGDVGGRQPLFHVAATSGGLPAREQVPAGGEQGLLGARAALAWLAHDPDPVIRPAARRLAVLRRAQLDADEGRPEPAHRALATLAAGPAEPDGGRGSGTAGRGAGPSGTGPADVSRGGGLRPGGVPGNGPGRATGHEGGAGAPGPGEGRDGEGRDGEGRDGDWVGREAAATLALLEAVEGHVVAAGRRLDELGRGAGIPAAAARTARLAAVLVHAQQAEQDRALGELDRVGSEGPSSRLLRCVLQAVRAARAGAAPFVAGLDRETLDHPVARRALLALGVTRVVGPQGRPVPLGGPAERLVERARRPSDGGAEGPTFPCRPAHPRTLVEALVLAALAPAGRDGRAGDGRVGDGRDSARSYDDGQRPEVGDGWGPEVDDGLQALVLALRVVDVTGVRAPLDARRDDVRELLGRHLAALGPPLAPDARDRPGGETPALVEPLTAREREVLGHLPTLMTNDEIATSLHLSVNTVKTHLKAVYRKLGVAGRRQAVNHARDLGIL